jgi:hypothetical protein
MAIKVTVPLTKNINTSVVSTKSSVLVSSLKDVVIDDVGEGDTLVYNATTKKWEAKSLDEQTITRVDGGTF